MIGRINDHILWIKSLKTIFFIKFIVFKYAFLRYLTQEVWVETTEIVHFY